MVVGHKWFIAILVRLGLLSIVLNQSRQLGKNFMIASYYNILDVYTLTIGSMI